jgi:predicted unusual protein kinase regulating ubiquinone biosynthesis (AarF/ABC1/UbiB family)
MFSEVFLENLSKLRSHHYMGTAGSIFQNLKWAAVGISSVVISKIDKEKGKKFLLESFKTMPGLPAKFAQILDLRWNGNSSGLVDSNRDSISGESSDREGLNPKDERASQQKTLLVEVDSLLSIEEVKGLIQQDMPELFSAIEEIDIQGKSASLGQVHWAKMKSGEEVAIKVQYPGLDSDLPTQLESMLWLMEKSPAKNFGLNISDYRKSLGEYIGRELDYDLEAKMQTKFAEAFIGIPNLIVPMVFNNWSGRKILTQEYLHSEPFNICLDLPEKKKEEIARTIVEFWLTGIFQKQLIHTDLQPKNWGYNEGSHKVVLYDFGSWIEIAEIQSLLLEAIIDGVLERKNISPLDYLVALGFEGEKLLPLLDRLPVLLEKLLDPFLTSGWWRASDWNLGVQLDEILGGEAWWFRTAGPPWFLWLMRSAQGLFGALNTLNVGVPFQSVYYDVINKLAQNRKRQLVVPSQVALLQKFQKNEIHFKHEARQFCVKVTEDGNDIVSMEFPIHVVQELELLMSDEVREKIESQGYNLIEIKKKIIRAGLLKGVVLDFNIDRRRYILWLQ